MAYNRSGKILIEIDAEGNQIFDNFSYDELGKYSDYDYEIGSIFVPIDRDFRVIFTDPMDEDTVSVYTNNKNIEESKRGKRGSLILTHIVNPVFVTGSDNNDAGFRANPPAILSEQSSSQSVTGSQIDIVEFETVPEVLNSTTFNLYTSTNLSSNLTYFVNVSEKDIRDETNQIIKFDASKLKGFTTDNTKSMILKSDKFYDGFYVKLYDDSIPLDDNATRLDIVPGLRISRQNKITGPVVADIISIDENKNIKYQLRKESYKLNVAYSVSQPTIVTSPNHRLETGDKITIYDIVSGVGLSEGSFTINKLSIDTFEIINSTTIGGVSGYLNYYVNFMPEDIIVSTSGSSTMVERIESTPSINNVRIENSDLLNVPFETIKDTSNEYGNLPKGKFFGRQNNNNRLTRFHTITDDKIVDNRFSNNSVLDISYNNSILRNYITSNSIPDFNITKHPFDSSAPTIIKTIPEPGKNFTDKLLISTYTRISLIEARIIVNHSHNFKKNDPIYITGANENIFNGLFYIKEIINDTAFSITLRESDNITGNSPITATGNYKINVYVDQNNFYEKYNTVFVNFSQSMNTSTISVANSTHLIYSDGRVSEIKNNLLKTDSSIQLSYDDFETLIDCKSISANTGNSYFAIEVDNFQRGKTFKIKVKTSAQDLGKTNVNSEYITTEPIQLGFRTYNAQTNKEEILFGDVFPPTIKKVYFTRSTSSQISGAVLYSDNNSIIDDPLDLNSVSLDLSGENLVIQFSESMNADTITVNTLNTRPIGSVQLSCDNFTSVVQFERQPEASKTIEVNDTYTFALKSNLSGNSNYILKVSTAVGDTAKNINTLEKEFITNIRSLTLDKVPLASLGYVENEILRGSRKLIVRSNRGDIEKGDIFVGLNSRGKGHISDLKYSGEYILENAGYLIFESADDITDESKLLLEEFSSLGEIFYNEIPSNDGNIKNILPGEICEIINKDESFFSVQSVSITEPSEMSVISYSSSTKKLLYRLVNDLYPLINGDKIKGYLNNSYGFLKDPVDYSNAGFTTATTDLTAKIKMKKNNDTLITLSPTGSAKTDIDVLSNVIIEFNQTMNVNSIRVPSSSIPGSVSNILLSFDGYTSGGNILHENNDIMTFETANIGTHLIQEFLNFDSVIPLSSNFTTSNNDTTFEFQPLFYPNIHLTQGTDLSLRIKNTVESKGKIKLGSDYFLDAAATVETSDEFKCISVGIYNNNGRLVYLTDEDSELTNIKIDTPLIFTFNEKIGSYTYSSTSIGLFYDSSFTNLVSLTTSFYVTGEHSNILVMNHEEPLATPDFFYVKLFTTVKNTENVALNSAQNFGQFTT